MWYFEYGKNLNLNILVKSLGYKPNSKKASLINYRVSFRKRTDNSKTGISDIVRKKGEKVKGVIYEITNSDLNKLDFDNGVFKGHYSRNLFKVIVGKNGKKNLVDAFCYEMPIKRNLCTPSKVYLNQMVKGLREHNIDSDYISLLLKKAFVKYNYFNLENERNLEQICNGKLFLNQLLNIPYCGASYSKKIDCEYISDNKDKNDLYLCMHPDVVKNYFNNHYKPSAVNVFMNNMIMRFNISYNDKK
jgi:hypothetical protein